MWRAPAFFLLQIIHSLVSASAAEFETGKVFRDCHECPELVIIPAGSFQMGTYDEMPSRANERPLHLVQISHALAVGRYPVTFDEWDTCVEDGGCGGYRPDHVGFRGPDEPGWYRGRHPVFRVNYQDIQSYLAWINQKTDGGYRLLSEAEWEYMARAGTTSVYHTGDALTLEQAKFRDRETNYASKSGNWRVKTVPVGSFPPNSFGIYDVHGGIRERVEDCFHLNYIGAPSDGSAWILGGDCSKRITRGGGWNDILRNQRISSRRPYPVSARSVSYGFRVARTLGKGTYGNRRD